MKFAYSRVDGGVSIVGAAPKAKIEQMLGPLTYEEYVAHIMKAIPSDAIEIIFLPDDWKDTPAQFCRIVDGKVLIVN